MPTKTAVRHSVLLVSWRTDDHAALRDIFRDSPWELQGAFTGSDGLGLLRRNHHEIFVVICERNLPDGDWKSLLAEMDKIPVRPSLIVSSRLADERLWAEVLNLGAFDLLLSAPFEAEEVLRMTQSVWLACSAARERGTVSRIGAGLARGPRHTTAGALAARSGV